MPYQDKQAITLSFLFAVCEGFRDEEGSKWQGEGINLSQFISEGTVMGLQPTRCQLHTCESI
jgi:hypothetical protein